jgi:SWI/SNF-related matrix-associated actin-dependent regulator 1 of chromatin subfamily A
MKKALLSKADNLLYVTFKLRDPIEWGATLNFVKTLPGRDFKPKRKHWVVPALKENIEALEKAGFEITGDGINNKKAIIDPKLEWEKEHINTIEFQELRDYQIDALRFLKWRNGRGLLLDKMGLGKTVQSLSYAKLYPSRRPILVICPATIKLQWKEQYKRWVGEDNIRVLYGQNPYELNPEYSYIINWDILSQKIKTEKEKEVEVGWVIELLKINFKIIIGDEIQKICNPGTNRTKAFTKLAKRIPDCIGLSGTPITSRPYQFFTALNLMNPLVFRNRWKFYERYCDLKSNGFGWSYKGLTNAEELHELVKPVMIRREKEEVEKELPKKNKIIIPIKLDGREKVDIVIEWIKDFLDSGEKLVVFAWKRSTIEQINEAFKKVSVKVYGGTDIQEREENKKKFIVDNNIKLYIGNIVAAGVGVDGLQEVCSNALMAEFVHNPKDLEQAEDRLHRIGQGKSVNIYYLVSEQDREDYIWLLDEKTEQISEVLDGKKAEKKELLGSVV